MKRKALIVGLTLAIALTAVVGAAMAGVMLQPGQYVGYKFQPRSWDFIREDGSRIVVMIDPKGTLTVLEDGVFLGQRYDSCTLAD